MGSLTSRPNVPRVAEPQIIYVPQPLPSTNTTSINDSASQEVNSSTQSTVDTEATAASATDQEAQQSSVRKENLLSRGRSRFGTVNTSFRGLLGSANTSGARKTLLGA